jgi:predicted nucleotidyltransferase
MKNSILLISKILEENKIPYFITAGTSLFLRKIIDSTKDIDISVLITNPKTLKKIFGRYTPKITKYSVKLIVNGYEVELLLTNKQKDIFGFKVFENGNFDYIYIHNHKLKIIKLKDLLSFYRIIYLRDGKDKHLKRIILLNKACRNPILK